MSDQRISDEMVETGARASNWSLFIDQSGWRGHIPYPVTVEREQTLVRTRAALEAVLPPLLERVEAAEAEHGALLKAHTELLGQFAKVYDQRDALAAKVADASKLADEWQAELDQRRIVDDNARYCWGLAAQELRTALTADEAAR